MNVGVEFLARPAVLNDQRQIANLMHFSPYVHRHLDWRYPLDWLGSPPFYVLENQGQISAALACPPDPIFVAWVRLFVNSGRLPNPETWRILWDSIRQDLGHKSGTLIAAIVLQDWLPELLLASGMTTHQSIVMLERNDRLPLPVTLPEGFTIRLMITQDLLEVADVDASAFEPLWQNSLEALHHAFPQAIFPTVIVAEGKVIGYQLTTRNPLGAHLARLAVRPSLQGQGLGRALVADLIARLGREGISRLTVNTQSDNAASLALYNAIGFRETGERYPVYQLQVA
jgi:[ribosomal protein S18]-alanine N-acetyltransferase